MKLQRVALPSLCLWVLFSTLLGRSFTYLAHGTNDAALFAYIALRWLRGARLYVDVWDNKPPGIFAVNAMVFSVFPKSFGALAAFEGFVVLVGVVAVCVLLRQARAPTAVVYFAVAAFAAIANLRAFNQGGNLTEIYLLFLPPLSLCSFWKALSRSKGQWLLAAGCLSGAAALFKQVGFASVFAEISFVIWQTLIGGAIPLRRCASRAGLLATGALTPWLAVAVCFRARHALGAFWYACFTSAVRYSVSAQTSGLALERKPFVALSALQPVSGVVICAVIGLAAYWWEFRGTTGAVEAGGPRGELRHFLWPSVFLWLAYDLVGALAGRDYSHYFLALAPSLAVAASFSFWSLLSVLGRAQGGRALAAAFAALALCPLVFSQAGDVLDAVNLVRHPPPKGAVQLVSDYLAHVSRPHDTLFMWDYLPEIYLETEMTSPVPELSAVRIYQDGDRRSRRQQGRRILAEMTKALPTFLVDADFTRQKVPAGDPDYAEFRTILQSDYHLVHRVAKLRVYARRSGVPPPLERSETPPVRGR